MIVAKILFAVGTVILSYFVIGLIVGYVAQAMGKVRLGHVKCELLYISFVLFVASGLAKLLFG